MKKTIVASVVALASLGSTTAIAFEKGDIIVRGGLATVAPDESTSNVFVGGADLGVDLQIENNTQLGLNVAYFITDNINIEVLAATPFKHDVDFGVSDPLGTGDQLGEVTHLPPTVSANYYFLGNSNTFKPYVGLGINYTFIYDESFTAANQAIGLNDLSLDNSFGLAAQIGADVMVDENWFVNASIRYIDIDTEAHFDLNGVSGSVGSIAIDPLVYTFAIGYRF
ncbi:OmpW/AlkL family protein [Alteromonas oceanisediminis]|uniref:OmpW/AlkL family protein n=1 Tax=Alteromonas oceanisediminis TaxID=2836180 RepID=UPI001BDB4DDD|nr:OmpW family outer membrane protein [Alteromonas oceanisediminis]MBT0587091.1 outer membrane beta-barrel protein [Alteromonas oceanisediminis]